MLDPSSVTIHGDPRKNCINFNDYAHGTVVSRCILKMQTHYGDQHHSEPSQYSHWEPSLPNAPYGKKRALRLLLPKKARQGGKVPTKYTDNRNSPHNSKSFIANFTTFKIWSNKTVKGQTRTDYGNTGLKFFSSFTSW